MAADATTLEEAPLRSSAEPGTARRAWLAVILGAAAVAEIAWAVTAHDARTERSRAVAALDDDARAALSAKWERYAALSEADRQRLRDLHVAIEADADPESLRRTLADYQQWVAALPASASAQLVGLPPTEKGAKVAQLAEEQLRQANLQLGDADSKVLIAWLEKIVATHQDKMMAGLPQSMRDRLEQMGARERVWAIMLFALTQRGGGPKFENITPEEAVELKQRLSPQAQAQWNAARSPDAFKQLLVGWIRQSMERAAASGQAGFMAARVAEDDLKKFFETEMTEEERTRLLALPREELTMQLRREYFRKKGLWRDGPLRGGDGLRNDGSMRPEGGFGGGFGPGRPFNNRPPGNFGAPRPPDDPGRPRPGDGEKGQPPAPRPRSNDAT